MYRAIPVNPNAPLVPSAVLNLAIGIRIRPGRSCRQTPVHVMKFAALVLSLCGALVGQPQQDSQAVEQALIEAVQQGNEVALCDLIKKPSGREALFSLSDNSFMFELRCARMLAALLQQLGDNRIFVRQTVFSLLHQSDDGTIVEALLNGLLMSEPNDIAEPAAAMRQADTLYEGIHNDLSDEVIKAGKIVHREKSRILLDLARTMLRATGDPARIAFFERILVRAGDPSVSISQIQTAQAVYPGGSASR